ncbi:MULTISPECIES: nitrate/nitrite transporter [unclassified Nocardioides]|uniref:MFS transporter n=1 Tax=unclassified Nocardioides TaxID=2615069 RepID=UPI00266527F8|nr:MFS transporter [Nocardioides sp. Arc9.136]WKN50255.1 MFS transporter [Nocardioides sp. Arc9.136]
MAVTGEQQAPAFRTGLLMWGIGLLVYLLAVFHRTSLAVAGLAASERFDISASQLATFTMLQLLVYAAMQVPVGLLVDRWGSRSVLLTGLVVMTAAQVGFALATTYPLALVARAFVGVGDALTFICVLRLVTSWFPRRRIPLLSQLTGTLGQLGAVISAVPMTWALRDLGWTTAYLGAAAIGPVLLVALLLVLRDTPTERNLRGESMSVGAVRRSLAASWAEPGTRLGFWIHFTTPFSSNVLGLLWGYPFLVRGEGLSPAVAGTLLTVIIVAVMASGPVLGWLVGVHPWHRSTVVLAIVGAIATAWTVVLAWPGEAPLPLLVVLALVVGVGGPASMVGFDVGRTSNPPSRLASSSGLINQGGFIASLVLVVSIGFVLDWRTPAGSGYTADAFRWAMSTQYVLWVLGASQIWRFRRRARSGTTRDELTASLVT